MPSTWDLAQREKYLAESARAAGIEDPPRVEIVAWQNPDAVGDTLVRCLQEAGVPAERTADGYEYESNGDQREYAAANYECTAKYPVRNDIDRPVSDAEATMLHSHLVSEFIPCVERNLGQSLTRPEFDVYRLSLRGESLDPVFVELTRVLQVSDTQLESLQKQCRLRPPGFRDYDR